VVRQANPIARVELSPRENQLLEFATNGLTDQAIANELGISLATIATYWGRIRIKFGPLSRTEIVAKHLQTHSAQSIESLQNEIQILKQQLSMKKMDRSELLIGMNLSSESICLLDIEHRILYANEITLKWMGFSHDDVIGKQMVEFWPDDRKPRWHEWHQKFKQDPFDESLTHNTPVVIRHRDGSVKSFVVNLTSYETDEGLRVFAVARPQQ
jgi:PAS domain S-box-containing protein